MFHPDGPTFWELARQALSSTDQGYDLIAPKFDHTPFRTPDAMLEIVAARIAERGPVRRALDVCCGTGAAMRWLRPICTEATLGIDRSAGMLAEAERRLRDAPGELALAQARRKNGGVCERGARAGGAVPPQKKAALGFVRGDALAMPFRRELDLVTCFGAFGHILEEDEPRFVDSIARVLVPGGRFVFVTGELPPITSPDLWVARGFNFAMRVRNALLKPEFIMYYLTFLLPGCKRLLERRGFEVEVVENAFPAPFSRARLVIATLRS